MHDTAPHRMGRTLALVAAAALSTACAGDAAVGPNGRPVLSRAAALGGCDKLQAPAGSKLAFHTYASGVQIYRWDGASWVFVAPSADLFADAGGRGLVGIHYGGPTWQSVSGGRVVGTVAQRCTADPNAIPWLLLDAVPDDGPGIFHRTKHIQRVNTVGGLAPAAPGSVVGEEARVPYTAEYFFYRTR